MTKHTVIMHQPDIIELYQLLLVYRSVYEEKEAADAIIENLKEAYLEIPKSARRYPSLDVARNSRGAGRKRKRDEKEDRRILDMYETKDRSLRQIAKEAGCSLGHVQDVIRRANSECM